MNRKPYVAGSFYPGDQKVLKDTLADLITIKGDREVTGLISPHAGYVYSGACAGKVFGMVKIPKTVIILGVNHRGTGSPIAIDGHEKWLTPLGEVKVDLQLAQELKEVSPLFETDSQAGLYEHSLEVQVPFIQYLSPDSQILPITIACHNAHDLTEAGKAIGELLKADPGLLVVASTDMTHFLSAAAAKKLDGLAIQKIRALDPPGLFETVKSNRISMCGVAPTVMMLAAAVETGAGMVEEVEYTHSGKVSGDYNEVVAYYSALVY